MHKHFIIFSFGILMVFFSCEKREWNNPFDPDCPKEVFTPSSFNAVQQGASVQLSWAQSNTRISGFNIKRNSGDGKWQELANPGKDAKMWTDPKIEGGIKYTYKLVALAGTNTSDEKEATITPVLGAVLTTTAATGLTATDATSGGIISKDGGAAISARGVCYGTSSNPDVSGNKTLNGTGTGSFTSSLSGLTPNTSYYARAYATNSYGTAYGNEITFKTAVSLSPPTVTTNPVSTYTFTTALLGGNVTSDGNATVTERGVCYSTSQNPTMANNKTVVGAGTGTFSTTVSGLTANTTYYVRAYAINSQGTAYGNQVSFTTSQALSLPVVTTNSVSTFTSTTALLGGNVTSDGYAAITERGVCYSTSQNPTTSNNKTVIGSGTGTFSTTVSGLTANTIYYVRAYAINSQGTAYGTQVNFTTSQVLSPPTVTTTTVDTYTSTTALLGGNVTSDGNTTVIERGVCFSTSQNPSTIDNKTVVGSGTGTYSTSVSGLTANTTYYVRAYAINSQGTAYGTLVSFTTSPVLSLATVTTNAIKTFTSTTAILGGNVTSDGNATVSERGVCYSTSQNPTTANFKATIGSGTGIFSTTETGLTSNTTYYVRAYAINSHGTAYGTQIPFHTTINTVVDYDGDVYQTVNIGTQVWMGENLKTTKYNDGNSIPYVSGYSTWEGLQTDAFCWYAYDQYYKNLYGALYNWFAVNTSKLCPVGWHVPSNEEWTILINYLGTNASGDLKSTSGWKSPNVGATNSSGFSAIPGGYCTWAGNMTDIQQSGHWWSSMEGSIGNSWGLRLFYGDTVIYRNSYPQRSGLSIRCIQD